MKNKKPKRETLKAAQLNELVQSLEIDRVLNSQIRQVRWLYNNSNKCTMVYDEKLVRLIVQRLQNRISELEKKIK